MALTVDDLAEFLNVTFKDTEVDGQPVPDPRRRELAEHLEAAVATVEARTGPIWAREVAYTVRSINGLLVLPATHLRGISQIIGPAGEVGLDSFIPGHVDPHSGMIWLPHGNPEGPYVVTVDAGQENPPADLVRAVLYVGGHLWESQRGRSQRPGVLGEDRTGGAPAWAIPYTAQTLMEPYLLPLDARSA